MSPRAPRTCKVLQHILLHQPALFFFVCHFQLLLKVKWSRYRPGVAQRVGRGIALLFHDRGTRRGWVVSSTPQPQFTPGKDPVPIIQEAGWARGPVWTGGKSHLHRDSIPDRPARSQSLYRLSYPAHSFKITFYSSTNITYKYDYYLLWVCEFVLFRKDSPYAKPVVLCHTNEGCR